MNALGPLARRPATGVVAGAGRIRDGQSARLDRFVPLLVAAAFLFAGLEAVTFIAFPYPQIGLNVVAIGSFGAWLALAHRRVGEADPTPFVVRMAVGILGIVVINAIAQPTVVAILTVATILPALIVLPYLEGRPLRAFIALTWMAGLFVALMGEVMPETAPLPPLVASGLRIVSMGLAFGLVLFLLWQFSTRLKATARELGSLAALSSELAQTMDPLRIGDLMAEHLAAATGALECGICYWDKPGDRVLTYGYHPRVRRAAVAESYRLDDYPATRRLLLEGSELVVSASDPGADPAEVAYLHSIGMRSMAMIPLIARGVSIGIVELYTDGTHAFDPRVLELARTLADESAMALDNARLYEELRHQAFHDALTGLANRSLFGDRIEHALARSARTHTLLSVLFLDLDDFKTVNDRFGHAAGDQLLRTVAERLRAVLRPGDTAARVGGDEFAVLLEDIAKPKDAELVAGRLIDAVRSPIRLAGVDALVGASVGVAISTGEGESADDLLRNADFAMYLAKSAGKGRHELFAAHMRDGIAERAQLEQLVHHAVERDELILHYQPIVELATGSILGVEALVRWQPTGRRMLMPAEFIPMAEGTGEIVAIGRWVIEEACRQAGRWQDRLGERKFGMNVNLSAGQFRDTGLVPDVLRAVRDSGIDPASLTLEITESVLMQHTSMTISKLSQLRQEGVRLAIDDFGTGYSSLSYLDRFPIDSLKIDRTFVDGFGAGREDPVLVKAIIELGHALKLEVVAEGIERVDQLGPLQALGCRLGQGYLFARPLDVDALEALLLGTTSRQEGTVIALSDLARPPKVPVVPIGNDSPARPAARRRPRDGTSRRQAG